MNKSVFILISFLLTFQLFSQTIIDHKSSDSLVGHKSNISLTGPKSNIRLMNYSENSELKVIYKDSLNEFQPNKKPAIFIDGIFTKDESILRTIDMKKIESFEIKKENYVNNGVEFFGKILIKTDSSYNPKFMTLKAFSEKHIKLNTNPVLFQIDEYFVNASFDAYFIDENYILKIIIDTIKTTDKSIEINLVKLITRTPKNIEKANQIIIK